MEKYHDVGANGIIAGVQEVERVREGVAVLLNDAWHSAVIDFGCVTSRALWLKFRFSRVKVCVLVGYGPNEGNCEKRDRFWNDMDRVLDRVGNGYRLYILVNLSGWIGDRAIYITGTFGVPG